MEAVCQEALRQIEEKHYDAELLDKGIEWIIKYGVCFCRKNCIIRTSGTTAAEEQKSF